MIQFREHEVTKLIAGVKSLQDKTGSEYMWDEYAKLVEKLDAYLNEVQV